MIKRLLFMLMIALLAGTLVGWSTTVKVYSENGKMEEYNPRTGDRLVIPGEVQSVDLRGLDVTIVLDVSGANPNCLYYLNAQDKVPEGLDADRLIVHDNAIDELIIQRGMSVHRGASNISQLNRLQDNEGIFYVLPGHPFCNLPLL